MAVSSAGLVKLVCFMLSFLHADDMVWSIPLEVFQMVQLLGEDARVVTLSHKGSGRLLLFLNECSVSCDDFL